MDTLELTLFDVESKSSRMWSKLRRNVRAHKFRLKMCGASQYKPNRSKSTSRTFDRGGVFVKACPMYVDRTRTHAAVAAVSAVAAAEQQPEGCRFVPDTILPGYQWAPQWVPARTPTIHCARSAGRPWVARTQFNTAVAQNLIFFGLNCFSVSCKIFHKIFFF